MNLHSFDISQDIVSIKNFSLFIQMDDPNSLASYSNDMLLPTTTLGWICSQEERVNAKKKIEIKHSIPYR
jgi:hypothetical protein